jgi:hypothetical protein
MKRFWLALLVSTAVLCAQAPPAESPALEFTGPPLAVPYTCDESDLDWAGLSCSDEPCPIYVELSYAEGQAKTILITGDFHAAAATTYSLLLRSEDEGRTWREPFARVRGAELDHIQMYDPQYAWISGQIVQPLALDPFFLLTSDGGKTWERVALFEEGTPGTILQFVFDSRDHGLALIDRGGGHTRYEVYETQTGGHSWDLQEKSEELLKLKAPPASDWRVHAENKLYRLQHKEEGRWSPFASFAIPAAVCRVKAEPEAKEPSPQP